MIGGGGRSRDRAALQAALERLDRFEFGPTGPYPHTSPHHARRQPADNARARSSRAQESRRASRTMSRSGATVAPRSSSRTRTMRSIAISSRSVAARRRWPAGPIASCRTTSTSSWCRRPPTGLPARSARLTASTPPQPAPDLIGGERTCALDRASVPGTLLLGGFGRGPLDAGGRRP